MLRAPINLGITSQGEIRMHLLLHLPHLLLLHLLADPQFLRKVRALQVLMIVNQAALSAPALHQAVLAAQALVRQALHLRQLPTDAIILSLKYPKRLSSQPMCGECAKTSLSLFTVSMIMKSTLRLVKLISGRERCSIWMTSRSSEASLTNLSVVLRNQTVFLLILTRIP